MTQPKYGLRGKDLSKVAAKFAADEKAREERKKADKKVAAEQRVATLRKTLQNIVAGVNRDELLESDMPYITAADALDICNEVYSKHPNDAGLRRLKAEVYVDYIKDDMKTYTVNEMTHMRTRIASENPSSCVDSVIKNRFATASIFQEDFKKYASLASQIKSQEDFETVLAENGIVGDDMKTFRAQCMIAKLAQMNMEPPEGEDMGDESEGQEVVETTIPSPNTGEELKVTVETESGVGVEGPEDGPDNVVDNDPVELLGQLDEVQQMTQEMSGDGMDMMPVPQNIEDLPPVEDLVDGDEEGTAVTVSDPSSDSGEELEIILDTADPGEEPGDMHQEPDGDDMGMDMSEDSEEPDEDDEKQAFEDPNHTLRRKLRKLLRRSLGGGKRKRASAKHPCIMYYNASGNRSELDRFRAYDMIDALAKVTKYAVDSGLSGKVYASTKEAAIELDSGNLVTFYLGETDYSKKIANLKYEDAYRYVRRAGVNLGDAENKVLDGKALNAYGYKLAFNNEGDYEFSHNGNVIRTADIMNFRPLLKDFVMQAAVEHLKHAQDEDLMNEINDELDMFVEDFEEGDSAGLDLVELDNGMTAEIEKNGPEVRVLEIKDADGNPVDMTPELEEEAMSKYQLQSGTVEDRIAKLNGVEAFTFKCASCDEFSTVPMPMEACNLDCAVCGTENTRGQIIASLNEVSDISFNYLFKAKNATRIASNLEDRGLYTDVVNGMIHIAEGSLSEEDILQMVEEEMGELDKEAQNEDDSNFKGNPNTYSKEEDSAVKKRIKGLATKAKNQGDEALASELMKIHDEHPFQGDAAIMKSQMALQDSSLAGVKGMNIKDRPIVKDKSHDKMVKNWEKFNEPKEADGPLGGDGQGAGPQYPNMVQNQDLRQAPIPGVQEQQKELIQYDTGNASPDQQRDDPGGVSQDEMNKQAQGGSAVLNQLKGMGKFKEESLYGPLSKIFDRGTMKQLKTEYPDVDVDVILRPHIQKGLFHNLNGKTEKLNAARKILDSHKKKDSDQGQGQGGSAGGSASASKQASLYRVAYILDGEVHKTTVKANNQFQIRSYFSKNMPRAFIKSAQEMEDLSLEKGQTAAEYFDEYLMDNEMSMEDVDVSDFLDYLVNNASDLVFGDEEAEVDVDPEAWWDSTVLDEEQMQDLQDYIDLYFEDDSMSEDDVSLEVDPLNEDMSFMDDRVAQLADEKSDTMPVPKSAPQATEPEDVGDESTFNLEQPVDSEAYEEIKSAFMYYRHEGLGPAEAIKKFMTEYDDENYDQSEIIRICGLVYAGDPLTQELDLQNLVPGGTGIGEGDLVEASKEASRIAGLLLQASQVEDSILKAVVRVAKAADPLKVIVAAANDLSSKKPQSFAKVNGKAYTKKQHHNMDMSLKSPKAFAGVTSKNVKGEGKFPTSDKSLKSPYNYPKAFSKVDSKGVSGDPATGGKENAMNAKDVMKGDKAHNNHFRSVDSKPVSGDPMTGNKEGATTKDIKSLRDNSQNAFGGVDSKPVSGYDDISHPRVDNGSRSLKAYMSAVRTASAIKTRIASLKKSASPEMAAEIQELQMTLDSIQKKVDALKERVVDSVGEEKVDLPPFNLEDFPLSKEKGEESSGPSLPPFELDGPSILDEDYEPPRDSDPFNLGEIPIPGRGERRDSPELEERADTFSPDNEEFLRRMEQRQRRRDRRKNRYSSQDMTYSVEDLD